MDALASTPPAVGRLVFRPPSPGRRTGPSCPWPSSPSDHRPSRGCASRRRSRPGGHAARRRTDSSAASCALAKVRCAFFPEFCSVLGSSLFLGLPDLVVLGISLLAFDGHGESSRTKPGGQRRPKGRHRGQHTRPRRGRSIADQGKRGLAEHHRRTAVAGVEVGADGRLVASRPVVVRGPTISTEAYRPSSIFALGPEPGSGSSRSSIARVGGNHIAAHSAATPTATPAARNESRQPAAGVDDLAIAELPTVRPVRTASCSGTRSAGCSRPSRTARATESESSSRAMPNGPAPVLWLGAVRASGRIVDQRPRIGRELASGLVLLRLENLLAEGVDRAAADATTGAADVQDRLDEFTLRRRRRPAPRHQPDAEIGGYGVEAAGVDDLGTGRRRPARAAVSMLRRTNRVSPVRSA